MLLISFLFTTLTMPMAWSTPTGPVYKTRGRTVAIENLTWEQLPKEAKAVRLYRFVFTTN